jgi:lipoprotein-anchoring transpeptidase ErfK/SrfK
LRKLTLVYVAALIAVSFGGCAHSSVDEVKANWTARDRQLLANPPYAQAQIPEQYKRHTVNYPRKEAPGTIVVDTDNRYLYLVLPQDQAIRYGVTVGEEALAWSGLAKVGRMQEWPAWVPTQEIKHRLGNIPDYVSPGPQNPMGARALYSPASTNLKEFDDSLPASFGDGGNHGWEGDFGKDVCCEAERRRTPTA